MIALVQRQPAFQAGQLVRHRRYGYRGVVVEYDACCQAPASWYNANQTQPSRQQPWYHVLVHETSSLTYAAETSLIADDTFQPIEHPLLNHFFTGFDGQRYVRNSEPFSGW